jgi:heme exporter protein D
MSAFTEILQMGGYAFYVWTSYGLSLVVLLWCIIAPRQREKQLIRSLQKRQEREDNQS